MILALTLRTIRFAALVCALAVVFTAQANAASPSDSTSGNNNIMGETGELSRLQLFRLSNTELPPWSALEIVEVFLRLYSAHDAEAVDYSVGALGICILFNAQFSKEVSSVELCINDQSDPNAFALPPEKGSQQATICLSRSLLATLTTLGELAFVLAHETAHIIQDHFEPHIGGLLLSAAQIEHIKKTRAAWELEADYMAVQQLQKSGFSTRAAFQTLQNFTTSDLSPTSEHLVFHPQLTYRLALLGGVN
jgi:Zn-dependent protease with chaperone function